MYGSENGWIFIGITRRIYQAFHALFACGIAELENSIGDKKNGQWESKWYQVRKTYKLNHYWKDPK